eukprot:6257902-Amphidinium_carterae.1
MTNISSRIPNPCQAFDPMTHMAALSTAMQAHGLGHVPIPMQQQWPGMQMMQSTASCPSRLPAWPGVSLQDLMSATH